MLAGRFEEAWRESDSIGARGCPDPYRYWDGHSFKDKRVVIRCLHGFGDAIQFIRYAPFVRHDASHVIVQTHPELVSLLRGVPLVDDVITWSDEGAVLWDQQVEVMELPRAFRTTLQTIPAEVPYLFVSPEQRKSSRITPWPGEKPRIGLQWGASEWNTARSIRLEQLLPILQFSKVEYYSFQRGAHRAQLEELSLDRLIKDVAGDSPEIVEAAADLTNIDLLITVDTMLAHLAGALGKPVWVLLPWEADWRWMLDRRDTPWYPTATLFRQPSPGDWTSAVRQMTAELTEFLTSC